MQHELFALGAELSSPKPLACGLVLIGDAHVEVLEQAIDHFECNLPPLDQFILPGGTLAAASVHVAQRLPPR